MFRAKTIGIDLEIVTEENYANALELAKKCDQLRKS